MVWPLNTTSPSHKMRTQLFSASLLGHKNALEIITTINFTKQQLDGYWFLAEMAAAVRLKRWRTS